MHKRHTLDQFGENLESIGHLVQKMRQKLVSRSSFPPFCSLSQRFSVSYIYEEQVLFEFGENLAHIGQLGQEL